MKRKLILVLAVVVLLASVFPVSAFAKDMAGVKVWIRNSTGGVVQLSLTDANGNLSYKTVEPGVFEYTLTDGLYGYYASTACGNYAGQWNFSQNKTLILKCVEGTLAIETPYKCEEVGWYATDYWGLWFMSWTNDGRYHFSDKWDFLQDETSGDYYQAWWGCWSPKTHANYGW